MSDHNQWEEKNGKLVREFEFENFVEAMKFVNAVASIAEAQQHHPDMRVSYNKVVIETWTHDANSITEKDSALTDAIDAI